MTDEIDAGALAKITGHTFSNSAHLANALTRHAFAKENSLGESDYMDSYATLGDAVIDLIVIEYIILHEKEYDKGIISTKKSDLVNMSVLRRLAEEYNLKDYVRWGRGEKQQHIWTSGRVLAECMEALCGAIYLDGGIEPARDFLRRTNLFV